MFTVVFILNMYAFYNVCNADDQLSRYWTQNTRTGGWADRRRVLTDTARQ